VAAAVSGKREPQGESLSTPPASTSRVQLPQPLDSRSPLPPLPANDAPMLPPALPLRLLLPPLLPTMRPPAACRLMPAAAAAAAAASHVFPPQCEYSRSIEISDLPKRCFNSLAKLVSKRERKNWTDFQQVYAAMISYSPAS